MPNNLSALMGVILARGLMVLRSKCVMPRLVLSDFSTEMAQKGDAINFALPGSRSVYDVTPGATSGAAEASNEQKVSLLLNHWKGANFSLNDKEAGEINASQNFIPRRAQEAFEALAKYINTTVFAEYKGVYGIAGTPGTSPFASDAAALLEANKVLAYANAPSENRRCVLDPIAEANALALPQFYNANQAASDSVPMSGKIGHRLGFDFFTDPQVPLHSAGTAAGFVVAQGNHQIGDTQVVVGTGTGTFNVGDLFTVAGDAQSYTVVDHTATTVTYGPASKTAFANTAAISPKGDHRVNLAFHRDAIAMAFRAPGQALKQFLSEQGTQGGEVLASLTLVDEVTGVPVRLEMIRQYKQIFFEADVLFGTKVIRPELACRLAG